MPIYEYDCQACGERFEKLIRSLNQPLPEIECPACHSRDVQRRVSRVAVHSGASEGGAAEEADSTVEEKPAVFGRKELQEAMERKKRWKEEALYGD